MDRPDRSDWLRFFAEQRLRPQVERLQRQTPIRGLEEDLARLLERMPDLFANYRPQASLLHGDLWGGPLHQLYHILSHANLAGGGYLGRARQLMQEIAR